MKLHPTLLAASVLLALLGALPARADDGILSFDLAEPQWANEVAIAEVAAPPLVADPANQPLPIPARATNPPMRYHSPQQLPAGVYRRGVAVALNESTTATALLPPAPPAPDLVLAVSAPPDPQPEPEPKAEAKEPPAIIALDFDMEPSPAVLTAQAELAQPQPPENPLPSLFDGDSDSLVAWAVGSAEGTRTPNGSINPAYFGHTDPGNRVWNMGTFSYQHGAKTPQEADQKQIARLKHQGEVLRQRALKHGLNLTLEETLNGLDLANQSPLASIGRVGYIERLAEAKANGYEGSEAILVARTRSYINPNTGRWNAPGLGNTEPSIRRDQKRRADAVAKAIGAYEAKDPDLQPQTWTLTPSPEPETLVALDSSPSEAVDDILQMWTSPSDPVAQSEPATTVAAAAEPAPAQAAAPNDDRLAALWQLTVDRFAQIGGDDESMGVPQIASFAGGLFNGETAAETVEPDEIAETDETAAESSPSDGLAEPPEALDLDTLEPVDAGDSPTPEELSLSAADEASAHAPPTWAEVREAHQTISVPAPTTAAPAVVPGARPESAVYLPTADPDLELADEWVEPAASSAPAPDLAPDLATEENSVAEADPLEASDLAAETTSAASTEASRSEAIKASTAEDVRAEDVRAEDVGAEDVGAEDVGATTEPVFPENVSSPEAAVAEADPAATVPHPALSAAEGASTAVEAANVTPDKAVEPTEAAAEDEAEKTLEFEKVDLEALPLDSPPDGPEPGASDTPALGQ